jgi:hypothetical protein
MNKIHLVVMTLLAVLLGGTALGAESPKRLKSIDFEEDLVEGLNKRPLDSLQSVSDGRGKRRKSHLYRKRTGYRTEIMERARERGRSEENQGGSS